MLEARSEAEDTSRHSFGGSLNAAESAAYGAKLQLGQPESEPNTYGVVCLNFDADGGELGVGSGQGDVGVGDDWAGGDMGVM